MPTSEASTYTDPATGREITQLTSSDERSVHGYYDIPPWSPTTGQIAFSRISKHGDVAAVCVMEEDGSDLRRLAESRAFSANDGAMTQWSYDGARIYYKDRRDGQQLICWVDPRDGRTGSMPGSLRMLSPRAPINAYHSGGAGSVMTDRDMLDHDNLGVFLQDLETGESKLVASIAQCIALNPRRDEIDGWHVFTKHTKWSPDGERILFVFTNEGRNLKYIENPRVKDIYTVNADGSGLRYVSSFYAHPIWHPNSRDILTNSFWQDETFQSFVLIDSETAEWRQASRAMIAWGHPSYSPDGTKMVVDFVPRPEGAATLELIDISTGEIETLVQTRVRDHSHTGTHLHPVWSRDGTKVLYASDAGGVAQLCTVGV